MRILLAFLAFLFWDCVSAEEIIVVGKLITNEPMSYVKEKCPEDSICLDTWWKAVIQVDEILRGSHVPGRITAAIMQHTSMSPRYRRSLRFFVVEEIDDPQQRKKLRVNYYLDSASVDSPDK